MTTVSAAVPALDFRLARKYSKPGPRYTSYPTALHFTPEIERAELLAELGPRPGEPLSLYFHLPFCESLCWFCGCTTVITRNRSLADNYIDLLEREMDTARPQFGEDRYVNQLHFGGGTPNFLSADQLQRLIQAIHERFTLADDGEFSVELDPRQLGQEQVEAFREGGFNRASFGVQDCNPAVQKAVHRVQPSDLNRQAIRWLRDAGFHSLNLDLIYGLPGQTPESFADTLDEVIAYAPDRFAVFSYAHVPWMKPAQKILERNPLPDPDAKLAMLDVAVNKLAAAGFEYIGMDHFAKSDDDLVRARQAGELQRNFQGYSTCAGVDIAAFGMSGIGQSRRSYRQNAKDLAGYRASVEAGELPLERGLILSRDDEIRRAAIHGILCDLAIDFAAFGSRWKIDFKEYFGTAIADLQPLAEDGLVVVEDGAITVTSAGRFFLRNIAMAFDGYLRESAQSKRYSRTV